MLIACVVKAREALLYSVVRLRDLREAKSAKLTLGKAIMDFEFSDEQELLREQARGFLADNCPPTAVRKVLDGDAEYDAELWQKVVEMGWTATVIPEEFGGLGLSYLELVVIAEELGRAAAPIPFSSSVYLATEALLMLGSQEQKKSGCQCWPVERPSELLHWPRAMVGRRQVVLRPQALVARSRGVKYLSQMAALRTLL